MIPGLDLSLIGQAGPRSLSALARLVGATLAAGEPTNGSEPVFHGCAGLEDAQGEHVSFLANDHYVPLLETTRAGLVIVRPDVKTPPSLLVLRCKDPYLAFTLCVVAIHGYRRHPAVGVQPGANVSTSATLGEGTVVMNGATVSENCVIGARCVLYPGVFIGPRTRVGDDCAFHPNVVLYDDTIVGNRVTLHANTTIGQDGLGYAPVADKWVKIPQIGRVRIEDDVEMGANCSIDRATVGETVIGSGTKMSDQIAIGHGCKIAQNCLFVAQVGLAGSVKVGPHVMFGGQAGVVGHISIGENCRIAAQAGVTSDLAPNLTVAGAPAGPGKEKMREVISLSRLPGLLRDFKELRKKVLWLWQRHPEAASTQVGSKRQ